MDTDAFGKIVAGFQSSPAIAALGMEQITVDAPAL